jgi:hypothetical protein
MAAAIGMKRRIASVPIRFVFTLEQIAPRRHIIIGTCKATTTKIDSASQGST